MPVSIPIDVQLSDTLTASICSHLAVEFFKYIAYQRQQIPFPFKQLVTVLDKGGTETKNDQQCSETRIHRDVQNSHSVQVQNEYRKVKGLFESMQTAFQNLGEELRCESGVIEEVAMILGATPLSPRDVFRLQFPPLLHGHLDSKHPHQSSLLDLLRCLISSEELNIIMNQPLAPTNMFLFLRRDNSRLSTSGFILKERYNVPSTGRHVIIRLIPPISPAKCICGGANIYSDDENEKLKVFDKSDESKALCWFQSHHTLKGFKDVKINGVSVSTVWLQSR